jgi:hypothetical protein
MWRDGTNSLLLIFQRLKWESIDGGHPQPWWPDLAANSSTVWKSIIRACSSIPWQHHITRPCKSNSSNNLVRWSFTTQAMKCDYHVFLDVYGHSEIVMFGLKFTRCNFTVKYVLLKWILAKKIIIYLKLSSCNAHFL